MSTNNEKHASISAVSPSETIVEMTELILPNDANVLGNVQGGRIMHWIDLAAAVAAHRHCKAVCVTAAIEGLSFLNPIKVGQLAHLEAKVVYTGTTSLVTKVVVKSEDMDTGEIKKTSEAYLTFVNLGRNGKPSPVPPLLLQTEQEIAEFQKAKRIKEHRLALEKLELGEI
ncbi:MAG: acyl-CoA thioesterase [candidate division Zixibacteria bacterium]|nr:acyl-CoA thioesterase [candidate division Zixibacteria bacterium]